MRVRLPLGAAMVIALSAPAFAQAPQQGLVPSRTDTTDRPIIVTGTRDQENAPSIVVKLRDMIDESRNQQLARFETRICPMVIGMPRDLTPIITRMIRANIVATGGEVGKPGCKVNAATIFIDQPRELVIRLRKAEPEFFMGMTPRAFYYFSSQRRPVYSWHTVNRYSGSGAEAGGGATASRLYTNIRDEMESGIVVIDRQATVGKTVRQLADFATMHLMLDVNWRARRIDGGSILALFHKRDRDVVPRMSSFDRTALRGFYMQRENNRTAAMQRQNIARAMRRQEEGKPPVGTREEP